jgi:hypothetical protein
VKDLGMKQYHFISSERYKIKFTTINGLLINLDVSCTNKTIFKAHDTKFLGLFIDRHCLGNHILSRQYTGKVLLVMHSDLLNPSYLRK